MIGVLALQGAFLEHLAKFAQLGVPAMVVRAACTRPREFTRAGGPTDARAALLHAPSPRR